MSTFSSIMGKACLLRSSRATARHLIALHHINLTFSTVYLLLSFCWHKNRFWFWQEKIDWTFFMYCLDAKNDKVRQIQRFQCQIFQKWICMALLDEKLSSGRPEASPVTSSREMTSALFLFSRFYLFSLFSSVPWANPVWTSLMDKVVWGWSDTPASPVTTCSRLLEREWRTLNHFII